MKACWSSIETEEESGDERNSEDDKIVGVMNEKMVIYQVTARATVCGGGCKELVGYV